MSDSLDQTLATKQAARIAELERELWEIYNMVPGATRERSFAIQMHEYIHRLAGEKSRTMVECLQREEQTQ